MRVIIAGSRKFGHIPKNRKYTPEQLVVLNDAVQFFADRIIELWKEWKDLHGPITEVVSGCANGIDTIAIDLAKRITGKSAKKFPAKWNQNGRPNKKAGIERNILMGEYADGAIIIRLPDSVGSLHMESLCRKKEIPYMVDIWTLDELDLFIPGIRELYS